jgi:hypothetical protein
MEKNELSKVTLTTLKNYLQPRSQEELMADITDLFNHVEGVQRILSVKTGW